MTKAKIDHAINRTIQVMVAVILAFQGWQTSTLLRVDKTVAVLEEKVGAMGKQVRAVDQLEERVRSLEIRVGDD